MTETLYKLIDEDMKSCHGGSGVWRKGRWRGVRGELVPCRNGIHLMRLQDLSSWIRPGQLWVAEHDGELIEKDNKVVVRRARILNRVGVLTRNDMGPIAADFAESVLGIYEKYHPGDNRAGLAISAARSGDSPYAAANAAYAAVYADAYAAVYAAVYADAYAAYADDADDAAAYAAIGERAERIKQGSMVLDYLGSKQ